MPCTDETHTHTHTYRYKPLTLHKGIVRTAMTKGATIPADRIKEPDVPAETAVWLATLPDSGPRGGFFRNKQPIAW